jgi:hypothetical protein
VRVPAVEWLPPICAWLAGAALLFGAAAASGHDPLHAATWAHSDSLLYEQIARHGYEIHRCAPGEGMNSHVKWCGTTAWFPAYPLLLAAANAIGLPLRPAALAISWLAALATLVLLWRWFLPRRLGPLAAAAFAPGLVYLYAIFPLSLLTLSIVVFLRSLERDARVAGGAGLVAALAYPLGVGLVPIMALVHVVQRRPRSPVRHWLLLGGPAVLAGVGIVVGQRLQTGRWTAYSDVASSYGGLHDPFTTITDWLQVLWRASDPFGYSLWPVWQFLFVTVLVVALVVAAIRGRVRGDAVLFTWCLGVWFIPLVQSNQSLWRSEAALLAGARFVTLLPRPLVWATAFVLLVLGFGVAHEFFAGTLI